VSDTSLRDRQSHCTSVSVCRARNAAQVPSPRGGPGSNPAAFREPLDDGVGVRSPEGRFPHFNPSDPEVAVHSAFEPQARCVLNSQEQRRARSFLPAGHH